jgi:hypothetical protein
MYSGIMLFFVGVPLLLGSWWGVAIAPLFAVLFGIRARIEERALVDGTARSMLTTPRACAIVWCPDFGDGSRMVDCDAR